MGSVCTSVCVFALSLTVTSVAGPTRADESGPRAKRAAHEKSFASDTAESSARLREGTELPDVMGSFKMTGDRLTFSAQGKSTEIRCLENLTLERVTRVISIRRDSSNLTWTVSGTATEYQGENFLLVRRAIISSEP